MMVNSTQWWKIDHNGWVMILGIRDGEWWLVSFPAKMRIGKQQLIEDKPWTIKSMILDTFSCYHTFFSCYHHFFEDSRHRWIIPVMSGRWTAWYPMCVAKKTIRCVLPKFCFRSDHFQVRLRPQWWISRCPCAQRNVKNDRCNWGDFLRPPINWEILPAAFCVVKKLGTCHRVTGLRLVKKKFPNFS